MRPGALRFGEVFLHRLGQTLRLFGEGAGHDLFRANLREALPQFG